MKVEIRFNQGVIAGYEVRDLLEVFSELENKTSKTVKTKALNIADVRRIADMISEQFKYRGFTFQRMTKDARWYVCYANQIVNWGQY